jgi:hypothetical protein
MARQDDHGDVGAKEDVREKVKALLAIPEDFLEEYRDDEALIFLKGFALGNRLVDVIMNASVMSELNMVWSVVRDCKAQQQAAIADQAGDKHQQLRWFLEGRNSAIALFLDKPDKAPDEPSKEETQGEARHDGKER